MAAERYRKSKRSPWQLSGGADASGPQVTGPAGVARSSLGQRWVV